MADFGRLCPDSEDKLKVVFDTKLVPQLQKICSSSSSDILQVIFTSKQDDVFCKFSLYVLVQDWYMETFVLLS